MKFGLPDKLRHRVYMSHRYRPSHHPTPYRTHCKQTRQGESAESVNGYFEFV
jgi:hypothetical protein